MAASRPPAALTYVLTAIVGFGIVIGIQQWKRAMDPNAVTNRPTPAQVNAHANAAGWVVPGPSAAQAPDARAADRKPLEAGGPLPVELSFHRRLAHTDPRERGRPSYVLDARLHNVSSVPLAVEIVVSGAAAQNATTIELDVGPDGIADFGADNGLEMHANDMITLRSPPFHDLTAQIP